MRIGKKEFTSTLLSIIVFLLGVIFITVSYFIPSLFLQDLLKNLGYGLIPGGIIGFLVEFTLRKEFRNELKEFLTLSLREEMGEIFNVKTSGIEDTYQNFQSSIFFQKITQTQSSITLLNTWIPNYIDISKEINKAILRDCKVRFLILNPESAIVAIRAKQLNLTLDEVKNRINATITDFKTYLPKNNSNVEVRLFDTQPVLCLYGLDGDFFVGLFWNHLHALQGPQIFAKQSNDSYFTHNCQEHFESIWNDSKILELK